MQTSHDHAMLEETLCLPKITLCVYKAVEEVTLCRRLEFFFTRSRIWNLDVQSSIQENNILNALV